MVRIKKSQLKEDKLVTTSEKATEFVSKHWKQLLIALVAVAVVIGGLVLNAAYAKNRNRRAAQRLMSAEEQFAKAEFSFQSEGSFEAVADQYKEARTKFEQVIDGGGQDYILSKALFHAAKCSYRLGEYDKAIADFQKIVDKHSGSPFALFARRAVGQCYEQKGDDADLKKAIEKYDELSRNPESYTNLAAFIDKGRCYEKFKDWDKALAAYNAIVDKFKWNVNSAIQASCMSLVGKAKEVISKYEAGLGKDQSYADIVSNARKKENEKQWFEALKLYDRAIYSRKQYWAGKKLPEGAKALREYEDMSSDVIRAISTGRDYEARGDWDYALRYYRRAVAFDFLPGMELFDRAEFRVDWINSVEKPS